MFSFRQYSPIFSRTLNMMIAKVEIVNKQVTRRKFSDSFPHEFSWNLFRHDEKHEKFFSIWMRHHWWRQKECMIVAAATWNTLNRKPLNCETCDEDKKGYLNEKLKVPTWMMSSLISCVFFHLIYFFSSSIFRLLKTHEAH